MTYWGLRDYGNEPQIWDSEPPERCEGGRDHVWGDEPKPSVSKQKERPELTGGGCSSWSTRDVTEKNPQGQFCQTCDAWRGSLGLEPTPELFISHMVQIFREVRRVLRSDGTLWLNISSSYASSNMNPIRSPVSSRVRACGSDDKEQLNSKGYDPSCPGCDGEPQGDCRDHHNLDSGNDQPSQQSSFSTLKKGHDSENPGSTAVHSWLSGVQGSTNLSLVDCVQDVSGLSNEVLEHPAIDQTSFAAIQRFSHTEPDSLYTSLQSDFSDCHKQDTELSYRASEAPPELISPCYTNGYPNVKFKPKDLIPIPWMLAMALQQDGWYLRQAMPWVKRSAMPESCRDRPASALEYMFLLSKSQRYYFDMEAIRIDHKEVSLERAKRNSYPNEARGKANPAGPSYRDRGEGTIPISNEGRNFRNTDLFYQSIKPPHGAIFCGDELVGLDINPEAQKAAHFATFPRRLVEVVVLSGTSEKGCCAECGAPWERVVEKRVPELRDVESEYPGEHSLGTRKYKHGDPGPESKTTGWQPGCTCGVKNDFDWNAIPLEDLPGKLKQGRPVPCTVLDPFGGSMTSAIVAHKHGRKFKMIELSQKYIDEIGIPRIEAATKQRGWNRFK